MLNMKKNILQVREKSTEKFEDLVGIVGKSAYEIALKNGLSPEISEEEWLNNQVLHKEEFQQMQNQFDSTMEAWEDLGGIAISEEVPTNERINAYINPNHGKPVTILTKEDVDQEVSSRADKVPSSKAVKTVADKLEGRILSAEQKIEQGLDEEQIAAKAAFAVEEWLDAHPEATTTVQDNSLTEAKFTDELKLLALKDYVIPQMYGAIGDGVANDTPAIKQALEYLSSIGGGTLFFPKGTYLIKERLVIDKPITIKGDSMATSKILVSPTGNYIVEGESEDDNNYNRAITFIKPSVGGGICDISIHCNDNTVMSALSIGSPKSEVASSFKCNHVKITNFINGLTWHTDWQAYFDHIYIGNCSDIGFAIRGSDTQFSNINITKCKCGMAVHSGCTKITNLKIDNCNTGAVHGYAMRIYGSNCQINNCEVQYCFPSGVIITSPNNTIEMMIFGIGQDALENDKTSGYYLNCASNCKNNDLRIRFTLKNNEIMSILPPDSYEKLYNENNFYCVANKDVPLWYAVNKIPVTEELTGYAYVNNDLATLKNKNMIHGTVVEDHINCPNGQLDIKTMLYLFPNIETDIHTSIMKIVTDKPIAIPFYYYSGDYGKNNKNIKLSETVINGKYTTYFLNYSEKSSGNISGLIVKSSDVTEFNVYELKALFYGENIDVNYAKSVMYSM